MAALILAWVAILLLGLAVGGLLAQIREIRTFGSVPSFNSGRVEPRMPRLPLSGSHLPTSVVFARSDCTVCHVVVPKLMGEINGALLVLAADELSSSWTPLPSGVSAVVDADINSQSGVPAFPWFAVFDGDGHAIESFALSSEESIRSAARSIRRWSTEGVVHEQNARA